MWRHSPTSFFRQPHPPTEALLQQTRTIPIIFGTVADPVGSGLVASLPRPGGQTTGFTNIEGSIAGSDQ
jgi:putative ABC transport system substrate-binding protein